MTTVLLIGKGGQVGWELQLALASLGSIVALDRAQLNLVDSDSIRQTIREVAPSIIVNAAGYTAVDKAEREPDLARQVNTVAPGIIGEEARRANALLVHYSTDYVFDGESALPYVEEDVPSPCNIYGKTKLEGEWAISASGCAHLILRTSWIYSARGSNFVLTMLRLAREKHCLTVVDDQIGSPTSARALAASTAELIEKANLRRNDGGIYHLSARDYASRFDFASEILSAAKNISGIETGWAELQRTTSANYPLPAQRPLNAATSKEKIRDTFGIVMAGWQRQLQDMLPELLEATARH